VSREENEFLSSNRGEGKKASLSERGDPKALERKGWGRNHKRFGGSGESDRNSGGEIDTAYERSLRKGGCGRVLAEA